MQETDVDKLGGRLVEIAKDTLRRDGELHPILVIEPGDGSVRMFCDLAGAWGDAGVRLMAQLGGTIGFGLDARRIYVVVDIYLRRPEADEDANEIVKQSQEQGLVNDPKAVEAICVWSSNQDGNATGWMTEYDHVEGTEKFTFKPTDRMSTGDDGLQMGLGTFDLFWEGQKESERRVQGLAKVVDGLDEDAMTIGRRAARRLAVEMFGMQIYGPEV